MAGFGPWGFYDPNSAYTNQQPQQQQPNPFVIPPRTDNGSAAAAPMFNSPILNPGDANPLMTNSPSINTINQPPGLPSQNILDRFLPPVLLNPFLGGINAAAQLGSYAAQAAPAAGAYQQSLYSPGLNPMEASFLGASGSLGMRGLESAFNQINAQYENTPFASTRFRQMTDAGNQFGEQMTQIGAQMAQQRQQLATQNLPFAFGFPLQAAQAGQSSAQGLYNLAQTGVYGDLQFPLSAYQSAPLVPSTIVQPAASGGGGKGK